jgi:hypothetical protein
LSFPASMGAVVVDSLDKEWELTKNVQVNLEGWVVSLWWMSDCLLS